MRPIIVRAKRHSIFLMSLLAAVLVASCAGSRLPGIDGAASISPRFGKSEYASIIDKQTGLEWFVGPDTKKTFFADAHHFVWHLRAGGHEDWRLPTMKELKGIRQPGAGPKNLNPIFETTGDMIWSGDRSIFGHTYIRLVNGSKGYDTRGLRKWGFRVFAVRNR
jgi:Protein of unknown function (DUF1566)